MPFLAVRVPVWFSKRYPDAAANLRSNADKLTTPFDLHETFKDILDMERPGHDLRQSRRPRAYSLFRRIPEDRTCADAHIAPHWSVLQISLLIYYKLAHKSLKYLNQVNFSVLS